LYFYYGLGVTTALNLGASATVNPAVGLVFDTLTPEDYTGWFVSVALSFGGGFLTHLDNLLKKALPNAPLTGTSTRFAIAVSPTKYTRNGIDHVAKSFAPLGITFGIGTNFALFSRLKTGISVAFTYYYLWVPTFQSGLQGFNPWTITEDII